MMTMKLSNGQLIPSVGLGTWQVKGDQVKLIIKEAIRMGCRHLDCAAIYENEQQVGQALRETFQEGLVKRSDLFITSKLWCTKMDPAVAEGALDQTLKDLGLDYLDLYLIHWPMCFQPDQFGHSVKDQDGRTKLSLVDWTETWKAMASFVDKGKVKSVGVSNFTIKNLERLVNSTGIVPSVNQVELHPYLPQHELLEYCKSKGILVEAYSPLGSGRQPSLLEDPVLAKVAEEEKMTPAQVLISWALTRGTVPLVKTSKVHRLKENFHVSPLSASAMHQIDAIQTRHRFIDAFNWAGHQVFDD